MKKLIGEKVGIVFGCYAPMHQGHLDVVFRAKKECDAGVVIIVCGSDNDRGTNYNMPLNMRYEAIKEFFKDDELVNVVVIDETILQIEEYPNGWDKWLKYFNELYNKNYDIKQKVWYVGEKDYKYQLEKRGEVAIYMSRDNNISATMIRNNPYKYWNKIVPTFRHVFSYNILITGTASEGKSTLVNDLAKYFDTSSTVEYGKVDLEETQIPETDLTIKDYINYLKNQYELTISQNKSKCTNKVFLGDTDNLVTMMYAKYYSTDNDFKLTIDDYKKIENEGIKYNNLYRWDKIYLLKPRNKFVDDGIRYMKHSDLDIRNELYLILCDLLKKANLWDKVEILDGNYYENFIKIKEDINEVIL